MRQNRYFGDGQNQNQTVFMTYTPKSGVPKRVRQLASALGKRAKGKTSDKKKASAAAANARRWELYRARQHAENLKAEK